MVHCCRARRGPLVKTQYCGAFRTSGARPSHPIVRMRFRQQARTWLALMLATAMPLVAQTSAPAERRGLVRAGRLIDVASDGAKTDQGILVTGERITRVGPYADVAATAGNAERVDLSRLTVLPGFIDAPPHV